jgi:hypothetical protein
MEKPAKENRTEVGRKELLCMWDGQTIKWEKNEVKDNTLDLESKTQNQR